MAYNMMMNNSKMKLSSNKLEQVFLD